MKLGHIHLKVRDLSVSETFYTNILELKVRERFSDQFLFLSFDDSHHDLALQAIGMQASRSNDNTVGLYHVAFEVIKPEELLQIIKKLQKLGSSFSLVDHNISWAVYTCDPDNNGIEVYLDRRSLMSSQQLWQGLSRSLKLSQIEEACY